MGHIFLSYSRKDTDFVQRLHEALEARGRETWADWEGIPPSDKWMARIHSAIDEAQALVFVLSADSVSSEVCRRELDYAFRNHKRVIPVLYREPDGEVPTNLAELNWVFARDNDSLDTATEAIVQAADTDLDWVKAHTRLLVRAVEWDRLGREASYTLRGRDLEKFEEWAAQAAEKEPKPTALQSEYLFASRRAVTRRQRITWMSITVGLCVAVLLGTIAWLQSQERSRQAEIAAARQLLSKAEALREIPAEADGAQAQHEEGLRAATQALSTLHALDENVFDADQSVRKSLMQLAKWDEPLIESNSERYWSPEASVFTPDGGLMAVLTNRGEILLIETVSGKVRHRCKRELDAMERQTEHRLAIALDGQHFALRTFGGTNKNAWNRLYAWDLAKCTLILEEQLDDDRENAIEDIALISTGSELVYWNRDGVTHFELSTGDRRSWPTPPNSRGLVFSPDRRMALALQRAKGERVYTVIVQDITTGEISATWNVTGLVHRLSWEAGGIVVTTRNGHAVHAPDGTRKGTVTAPLHAISALSPDGKLLAITNDRQRIEVRNVEIDALEASTFRDAKFVDMAFMPDGRSIFAVSSHDFKIGRWHFGTKAPFARLATGGTPDRIWFASDGASVYAAEGEKIALWSLPTADTFSRPELVKNELVRAESYTIPKKGVSSVSQNEQKVLAIADGEHGRQARLVCSESTRAGCRRILELWEGGIKRDELLYEPVLDLEQRTILQFAAQDRFVVIGTRTGLEVLDWQSLQPVTELFHMGAVLAGMSLDGRWGATMDRNHSIRVWDIAKGIESTRLTADGSARMLALSNDGRWLASLATDSVVELWSLAAPELIHQACRWLESPCP